MAHNITSNSVLDALRHVDDPDLKQDLVTLKMIKDLQVQGNLVSFTVELTTPACPMKEMIEKACRTAIRTLVSPEAVVNITMSSRVTQPLSDNHLSGVKNMIVVGSGKGGVGKSTVSVNLAVALAQTGARVGLVDADIYGPSAPIMFGLDEVRPYLTEIEGRNKMVPPVRHGVHVMSIGFLTDPGQAVVWRGPMASNALRQLIKDTHWDAIDYLIVDLPPGTGDIHITICQQFSVNGAVIVTTPQPVAVTDAAKALQMLVSPQINVPVLGIVENMAYFSPPDLPDRKYFIFGEGGGQRLADEFDAPLLSQLPIVEQIRKGGDKGVPVALETDHPSAIAFAELAGKLAQQVAIRNQQAWQQPAVPE
jgi:ATP-binding protein involved in chromosome partitioning